MKKKKGFTLIELLAVIIILAIIALIATPIIMRVISRVRESANERSVYNYIRSVETQTLVLRGQGKTLEGAYSINENGNLCPGTSTDCDETEEIKIEMKGTKLSGGSVKIEDSRVISATNLQLNGKYYNYADGVVSLSEQSDNQKIDHGPGAVLTDGNFISWDDLVNDEKITMEGRRISGIGSDINIQSLVIPEGVESIGPSAFSNLTNVASISIPTTVTFIDPYAFSGNTGLTSLIFKGMPKIYDHVFDGCTNLTTITLEEGITQIPDGIFKGITGLTSVTIPEGVTSIGSSAFSGTNLTSVTIPNSVTSIGSGAFSGTRLTSVTIPSSVTSIGSQAFSNCASLSAITVASDNTVYEDRNSNAIFLKDGDTVLAGCSSTVIPNSVTSIGEYAFRGSGLTSIIIPSTITSIGSGAFMDCTSLTSVTIQEGATSIGTSVFKGCTNLGPITIPASVTSIGKSVFEGCSGLTAIEFNSPTGWKWRTTGSWTAVDLSDPSSNASKFKSTGGVKKIWQVFES